MKIMTDMTKIRAQDIVGLLNTDIDNDAKEKILKDWTKAHVEAALISAADASFRQDDIVNSYPLENIK